MATPTQPTASRVIPPHPLQAAKVAAAPGNGAAAPAAPAPNQADWFANESDSVEPVVQPEPPPPPVVAPPPQQEPDLGEIDALLKEIGEPAPVVQPEVQAPPAPQPQAQPQIDPAAVRKNAIDYLMANEYRMDDTTARKLISEPEAVLPEIAARVHVNVMGDLGKRVNEMLPQLVDHLVQQRLSAHSAELEFFGRYPQLNRSEFRPIVAQSLAFMKQMNPNLSRDQLMQEGATLAAYRIKRSYRPTQPQQPATRSPVAPYTPVASGGGVPVPTRPNDDNIWAQMSSDPDLFSF